MSQHALAEIRGTPGNWRWRSRNADGHEVSCSAGYIAVGSAVDDIVKLFGEGHPIDVVRVDAHGRELSRHRHER